MKWPLTQARDRPSGVVACRCPGGGGGSGQGVMRAPVAAFQHSTSPWSPAIRAALWATTRLPSGLNATLLTLPECFLMVSFSRPVCAFHTFSVLSWLPLTMRLPSGLNATLVTLYVCPLRVSISSPVSASHTFSVLSSL